MGGPGDVRRVGSLEGDKEDSGMTELILILLLFNTVTNLIILFRAYNGRITFEWNETFWFNHRYGFRFMLWNEARTSAHSIFNFNFIPYEIANDRDHK